MGKAWLLFIFGMSGLLHGQYQGTASVTQGRAKTIISNLYNCTGGRSTGVGEIISHDSLVWTMPAKTHFSDQNFPSSFDLYNVCTAAVYNNVNEALGHLSDNDVIEVDEDGELITAFVFADNYFEMYINGKPVAKDKVPFTPFNSSIIRFKARQPFLAAFLLVDWEENLGLGSEFNGGFAYHPGDGGMVAVFKNSNGEIIAVTNKNWKAQTFYTSPIIDLSCPTESGTKRLSDRCSTQSTQNGENYYGLHWNLPSDVMLPSFNDSDWPSASEYSNGEIGVNNKPAYTNFTEIFDDPSHDAQFIWSTNVILDNEVVVRQIVPFSAPSSAKHEEHFPFSVFPNPIEDVIYLQGGSDFENQQIDEISVYDVWGKPLFYSPEFVDRLFFGSIQSGIYILKVRYQDHFIYLKLVKP